MKKQKKKARFHDRTWLRRRVMKSLEYNIIYNILAIHYIENLDTDSLKKNTKS